MGSQYCASFNNQNEEIFNADSYDHLALTTGDTGANNQISALTKFTDDNQLGLQYLYPLISSYR